MRKLANSQDEVYIGLRGIQAGEHFAKLLRGKKSLCALLIGFEVVTQQPVYDLCWRSLLRGSGSAKGSSSGGSGDSSRTLQFFLSWDTINTDVLT